MKRFISLALALCLPLTLTVHVAGAITTNDFIKKGTLNQTIQITEADFTGASQDISGAISKIIVVTAPTAAEGVLSAGGVNIDNGAEVPVASLSSMYFNPVQDFKGIANFTWMAVDSANSSGTSTAHLVYVQSPVAQTQTVRTLKNVPVDGQLLATDPIGLPLTYAIVTGPRNGDITFSTSKGTFTYTPDLNYVGDDSLTFTASNAYETSAQTTVTFEIRDYKAPAADDLNVDVPMKGTITSSVTATDSNTPPLGLTYTLVSNPEKGDVTFNADGTFTYTHNTSKLGKDYFTFKASNGFAVSNTATVTIDIIIPDPLPYRDMQTHWGLKSAGTLANFNFIVGDKIQSMYYYYPEERMTRAEYVLFLNSVMQIPLSPNTTSSVFADVSRQFMFPSLNSAFEKGVTSGTSVDGKLYFYPDKLITRIEAMKMLDNIMKFKADSTTALTFADKNQIPPWATQAVKNLVGYKIISGDNGSLRPLDLLTRAEAAQMLYLAYLEKMK